MDRAPDTPLDFEIRDAMIISCVGGTEDAAGQLVDTYSVTNNVGMKTECGDFEATIVATLVGNRITLSFKDTTFDPPNPKSGWEKRGASVLRCAARDVCGRYKNATLHQLNAKVKEQTPRMVFIYLGLLPVPPPRREVAYSRAAVQEHTSDIWLMPDVNDRLKHMEKLLCYTHDERS